MCEKRIDPPRAAKFRMSLFLFHKKRRYQKGAGYIVSRADTLFIAARLSREQILIDCGIGPVEGRTRV